DGRLKPDLLAPGVDVLAAWSAPRGSMRSPGELVRRSGTSMAAPAVTSAVALCLGAFGRRLDADELRDLILRNTRRPTAPDEIPARLGHGYLDLARLTDDILTQIRPGACRAGVRETMWPRRDPKEPSMARATDPTDVQEFDPDRLYRELTYSQDSSPARLDAMFVPLARPGERPSEPPQAGDVLVRVALGEPGRGHVAILSDGHLTPHTALGPVRAERGGSGYYAEVTDGPRCHAHPDPVWRRVLDTAGRLPPGQLLLRPRAQPASEPGEEEQNPVHDPMVEGPPMGEPETVQGTETGLEEQEVPAIDRRQTTSWAIASVGGGGFIVGYSLFLLVNRETGREHQIHIPTGGLSTYFGGASASSPSYTTFETRRPVSFADFDGVGVRLTTANLGVIFGYSIVYLTLWDGPAYASDRLAYIKMSGWGAMIPGGAVAHGVTKITYGSGARSGVVPLVFAPQPDDTVREPALTRIRLAARESPRIALPNEMLFDFDSVEIKPAAHTALLYLADLLNNRKRLPVEIEGHTDSTGGSKYNLALSARRAEAVKRWFVDRGVHGAADFRVVPYGEARPVATNTTAEGRRKNRRVVIKAAWGL
ncbi:OmpA family protein, partial [Streptomyces sp. NPDC000851]